MINEKRVGFYHHDCIDGTTAAAVLKLKYPNINLLPIGNDYTTDLLESLRPLLIDATELIIIDGTWGIDWCLQNFPALQITIIDHHISTHNHVKQLAAQNARLTFIYDQNHCASILGWKYFFLDKPIPELMLYVEDSDLWLEKFGDKTKYATSVISIYRNQPDVIINLLNEPLDKIMERGKNITEYIDTAIEKYIKVAPVKIRLGTYEVLCFNITDQQSVCGNKLAMLHQQAVALFTIKGGVVRFSFRSNKSHVPSALDLAITIGGGGHRNSSGGQVSLCEFIERVSIEDATL